MSKMAPVLVSVYDRVDHFKQCIAALQQAAGSDETELYIVSDKEKDASKARAVAAVRTFIAGISGFRRVTPILRETNFGFPRSIYAAWDLVLEQYSKAIFLEDDVVVAPGFLRYMNEALEVYADDSRVQAVCGWSWASSPAARSTHYFLRAYSAWGCGNWKHKEFDRDLFLRTAKEFRQSWRLLQKANHIMPHALNFLHRIAVENRSVGDISITLECIKKDLYCVFPAKPLIKNIGHDGSGLHCTHAAWVDSQELWQDPWPGLDNIPVAELDCHREASVRFFGKKSLLELVRLYAPLAPLRSLWVKRRELRRLIAGARE